MTTTDPTVHDISTAPQSEEFGDPLYTDEPEMSAEELALAEARRTEESGYTFRAGEVVVAEGDTAYSFTDTATREGFEQMPALRRAVIVARLRAVADMLAG